MFFIQLYRVSKFFELTVLSIQRICSAVLLIHAIIIAILSACIILPLPTHAQLAFKYLGVVLFPLFLCYAVYSLLYNEHKGWYSFILNMAYGFLLTFGEPLSQKLNNLAVCL